MVRTLWFEHRLYRALKPVALPIKLRPHGAIAGTWTLNVLIKSQTLYQLSYDDITKDIQISFAPPVGVEPTTVRLTAESIYQLSYGGVKNIQMVAEIGVEPNVSCLWNKRGNRFSLPLYGGA